MSTGRMPIVFDRWTLPLHPSDEIGDDATHDQVGEGDIPSALSSTAFRSPWPRTELPRS